MDFTMFDDSFDAVEFIMKLLPEEITRRLEFTTPPDRTDVLDYCDNESRTGVMYLPDNDPEDRFCISFPDQTLQGGIHLYANRETFLITILLMTKVIHDSNEMEDIFRPDFKVLLGAKDDKKH